MSDDLVTKMQAAADAVIQSANPEDSGSDEEGQETQDATGEDGQEYQEADATGEDGEAVEASASEDGETDGAAEEDAADQILAVRQSADRKVRAAESKVRDLESKLQRAGQYIEQSKRQVADDIFKKLRRAPAKTFKEFGFEFQDLIDAGIREGQSAEGPMNEIDELRQEMRGMKEERMRAKEADASRAAQSQVAEAKQSFLGMVSKNEFPTLYGLFEDSPGDLWNEAVAIARDHESRTGRAPDDKQVVKYLEQKYATKMKRFGVASAPVAPALAKKPMPRTLSTKAASETRTAGKPFGQLDADQQKAALLAAVKKATLQPAN